MMKLVQAVVRPEKLADIQEALHELGVHGMTVTEVRGCGQQKGRRELYRGAEYVVSLLPKVRLDLAVEEDHVSQVVATIVGAARTGEIGDGKIFIFPLEDCIRIRTGEHGPQAL